MWLWLASLFRYFRLFEFLCSTLFCVLGLRVALFGSEEDQKLSRPQTFGNLLELQLTALTGKIVAFKDVKWKMDISVMAYDSTAGAPPDLELRSEINFHPRKRFNSCAFCPTCPCKPSRDECRQNESDCSACNVPRFQGILQLTVTTRFPGKFLSSWIFLGPPVGKSSDCRL